MTELYAAINKDEWIYAPAFVRQRHRYRGQRESIKMNSEISGLRLDVSRLYEKYQTLHDRTLEYLQNCVNGGSVSAKFYFADDPVPALNPFAFSGVNDISLRIDMLRQRMRSL